MSDGLKWNSDYIRKYADALKEELLDFDKITCICGETYSLIDGDWLNDALPCPVCGYVHGDVEEYYEQGEYLG